MGNIPAKFNALLNSDTQAIASEKELVEDLQKHFPYFQSAAFLHTKILKAEQSFNFDDALQNLALLTQNRSHLYNVFNYQQTEENTHPLISDLDIPDLKFKLEGNIEIAQKDSPIFIKEHQDADFIENTDAFNIELKQPNAKEVKPNRTNQIIDGFLSNQKTAERKVHTTNLNTIDDDSLNVPDDLVSETLAKIYLKQEKFTEAIKVYEKLILIEPEKKTKFAGLIEEINKKLE